MKGKPKGPAPRPNQSAMGQALLPILYGLLLFVTLAEMRNLLRGAGAVFGDLDLRQVTLAACHVVAAGAHIAAYAGVLHGHHPPLPVSMGKEGRIMHTEGGSFLLCSQPLPTGAAIVHDDPP